MIPKRRDQDEETKTKRPRRRDHDASTKLWASLGKHLRHTFVGEVKRHSQVRFIDENILLRYPLWVYPLVKTSQRDCYMNVELNANVVVIPS